MAKHWRRRRLIRSRDLPGLAFWLLIGLIAVIVAHVLTTQLGPILPPKGLAP